MSNKTVTTFTVVFISRSCVVNVQSKDRTVRTDIGRFENNATDLFSEELA